MSQRESDIAADMNATRGSDLTNIAIQISKITPKVTSFEKSRTLPLMAQAEPAQEEEMRLFWEKARQFFRTGEEGGIGNFYQKPEVYPALLAPYRDMSKIRYDYPFWITDHGESLSDPMFLPLSELLANAIQSFAPEPNQSKELKENLSRLESIIRNLLPSEISIHSFRENIEAALEELQAELSLAGSEGEVLASSISELLSQLPQEGSLIQFSEETPFHCLAAVLKTDHLKKYKSFKEEIGELCSQLRNLLMVEQAKNSHAREPEQLHQSLGLGTSFIDPGALSKILPETSSEPMPLDRIKRIEKALSILENFELLFGRQDAIVLVPKEWSNDEDYLWEDIFPNSSIVSFARGKGCATAMQIFEEQMSTVVEWFSALRIARLEIKDRYHSEIHDNFFAYFDWKSFTKEEIALSLPLVLIEDETTLLESGLSDLSRLLLSNKPIKMMIVKRPAVPDEKVIAGNDSRLGLRLELGHLAVSHRNSMVVQSSVGNPHHLMKGLRDGIQATIPAFFYILSPRENHLLTDPYLWSGAALESREFPLFTYDPQKGEQWGSRFDIATNPFPSLDWPVYELKILDDKNQETTLSLAFTFADFASQDALYSDQFFLIPPCYWRDEMVPLTDFLKLSSEESYAKIPFIWMIDGENQLQKVMMSYSIGLACQDRLDYWHVIQDLGGINNYHAEHAAQKAREEAQEAASSQIAALTEEYQTEMERVKKETAGEAMEKLSSILLELDSLPTMLIGESAASEISSPQQETATPSERPKLPESPAAEPKEEVLSFDEPWIEAFRCTTCNECTELNPSLFHYNSDKQAYIENANAGTFKELVIAAEKCPAKCIHPGKPLNPNEADLEKLIKRAEPFN